MVCNVFMPRILHISVNAAAHKVGTPITQEPDLGPRRLRCYPDTGSLATVLGVWSGVTYANMCCREVVLGHQDVGNFRQFVQLHGCLDACKIHM